MHPSVRKVETIRVYPNKLVTLASSFHHLIRNYISVSLVDVIWRCFQSLWPNPVPAFGTDLSRGIPFNEYLGIDTERMVRVFGEDSLGIRVVWTRIGSIAFREKIQGDLRLSESLNGIRIPIYVCDKKIGRYTQDATTMVQLAEFLRIASMAKKEGVRIKWAISFLRLWDRHK